MGDIREESNFEVHWGRRADLSPISHMLNGNSLATINRSSICLHAGPLLKVSTREEWFSATAYHVNLLQSYRQCCHRPRDVSPAEGCLIAISSRFVGASII